MVMGPFPQLEWKMTIKIKHRARDSDHIGINKFQIGTWDANSSTVEFSTVSVSMIRTSLPVGACREMMPPSPLLLRPCSLSTWVIL